MDKYVFFYIMGKEERSKVVLNFVWYKKRKIVLCMIYIGIEGVVEGGGGLRWKSLLSRVFKKGFVYLLFVLWKYINLKGLSC